MAEIRYFRHPQGGHTVAMFESEVAKFIKTMQALYKVIPQEVEAPKVEEREQEEREQEEQEQEEQEQEEQEEQEQEEQDQKPDETPKPLSELTKAELEAKAAELSLDISKAANNGERVAAIQAKLEELAKAN